MAQGQAFLCGGKGGGQWFSTYRAVTASAVLRALAGARAGAGAGTGRIAGARHFRGLLYVQFKGYWMSVIGRVGRSTVVFVCVS